MLGKSKYGAFTIELEHVVPFGPPLRGSYIEPALWYGDVNMCRRLWAHELQLHQIIYDEAQQASAEGTDGSA